MAEAVVPDPIVGVASVEVASGGVASERVASVDAPFEEPNPEALPERDVGGGSLSPEIHAEPWDNCQVPLSSHRMCL